MILIVDDKQENIFSLKTVLAHHGFEIDAALSGEEALKKLLKNEYALVILDVQMPGMDGFEVAEAITGLNKTKDIPIIFLSAVNTHKRFITKGFESGAVEYLTKPVDADILILKVRNFYRLYEKTHALKEAEKALLATVDQLHTTLESLPQISFTANQQGAVTYVNRQWFGYGKTMNDFPAVPNGELPLQQLWRQSIAGEQAFAKEIQIKNLEDGQFYFHLLKATPIKVPGQPTKWVGTFTNIQAQKQLNETLEQKVAERTRELLEINRALEISNTDLQQFTSVASHDLKEPLRKILFFGNLINDRANLSETQQKYLDKILQSSARMNNLITDLLSFASLSQPNRFQKADINQIINGILTDLELSIEEKQASITVSAIPQLEVIPGLIRQLFQNLISNALKFSREGVPPAIEIHAFLTNETGLAAKPAAKGIFCRITIADNGIGFDEKYNDRIFAIFQRLNAMHEFEGTGIGLAIAKRIIDRHNGLIAATSAPGCGSVFYVTLPVVQDEKFKSKEETQFTNVKLP